MKKYIVSATISAIVLISAMACTISMSAETAIVETVSTDTAEIIIAKTNTKQVAEIKTPISTLPKQDSPYQKFTVSASYLYVRDMSDLVIDTEYLKLGDFVECKPTKSGWCVMKNSNRVWQGCLNEPMGFGCEER